MISRPCIYLIFIVWLKVLQILHKKGKLQGFKCSNEVLSTQVQRQQGNSDAGMAREWSSLLNTDFDIGLKLTLPRHPNAALAT